jgi:hypothetical protein
MKCSLVTESLEGSSLNSDDQVVLRNTALLASDMGQSFFQVYFRFWEAIGLDSVRYRIQITVVLEDELLVCPACHGLPLLSFFFLDSC